jgi:hypothetical protein
MIQNGRKSQMKMTSWECKQRSFPVSVNCQTSIAFGLVSLGFLFCILVGFDGIFEALLEMKFQ